MPIDSGELLYDVRIDGQNVEIAERLRDSEGRWTSTKSKPVHDGNRNDHGQTNKKRRNLAYEPM